MVSSFSGTAGAGVGGGREPSSASGMGGLQGKWDRCSEMPPAMFCMPSSTDSGIDVEGPGGGVNPISIPLPSYPCQMARVHRAVRQGVHIHCDNTHPDCCLGIKTSHQHSITSTQPSSLDIPRDLPLPRSPSPSTCRPGPSSVAAAPEPRRGSPVDLERPIGGAPVKGEIFPNAGGGAAASTNPLWDCEC